jgi:hypothetical protein
MSGEGEAAGPFKTVHAFGRDGPFYLTTYDRQGICTSPAAVDGLIKLLRAGAHRDVLLYSHGWNNDFPTAIAHYDVFLERIAAAVDQGPDQLPNGFSPVFVGIVWPSTAMTFGSENAPDFAGFAGGAPDSRRAEQDERDGTRERAEVLASLETGRQEKVAALLDTPGGLDPDEARQLAELIAPSLRGALLDSDEQLTPEQLLAVWRSGTQGSSPSGFGDFGTAGSRALAPEPAGILAKLDPRWLVRLSTVLLMKTRAGTVGRGVGELVRRILRKSDVRLTIFGHSYGAKVVLSALAASALPRPAEGVMLLQPAVSHLCFAQDIGSGRPGGLRTTLERVRKPILLTYSRNDFPLRRLFHLVARRQEDLGEVQILGQPSPYAALGGFGPAGCRPGECVAGTLAGSPDPLQLPPRPARILALDGTGIINGHSDVHGDEVMWAARSLLA